MPRPNILLLDEPFSGLDARLRDTMRDETAQIIHETGATCILVTHHAEEAMRMSDRIAILRKGQLIQEGVPSELYARPKNHFVASIFSDINEILCKVENGRVDSVFGQFPAAAADIDGQAVLCVRQADLNLSRLEETLSSAGPEGRVTDAKFLGQWWLFEVAVAGLDTRLRVKQSYSSPFRPGDEVRISADPARVMVFAPSDEDDLKN